MRRSAFLAGALLSLTVTAAALPAGSATAMYYSRPTVYYRSPPVRTYTPRTVVRRPVVRQTRSVRRFTSFRSVRSFRTFNSFSNFNTFSSFNTFNNFNTFRFRSF